VIPAWPRVRLPALQKLFSATYMSGAFFEYTLLSDARFEWLPWALGHLSLAQLQANRALVTALTDGAASTSGTGAVALIVTDQVRRLARAMTWFTFGMEATLALLFLMPRASPRRAAVRSILLVVFLIAVYPVAPVIGFAWILIAMGLAQLPVEYSRLRATLVGLFVVLPVVTVFTGSHRDGPGSDLWPLRDLVGMATLGALDPAGFPLDPSGSGPATSERAP
jgi:hypothetical protein